MDINRILHKLRTMRQEDYELARTALEFSQLFGELDRLVTQDGEWPDDWARCGKCNRRNDEGHAVNCGYVIDEAMEVTSTFLLDVQNDTWMFVGFGTEGEPLYSLGESCNRRSREDIEDYYGPVKVFMEISEHPRLKVAGDSDVTPN